MQIQHLLLYLVHTGGKSILSAHLGLQKKKKIQENISKSLHKTLKLIWLALTGELEWEKKAEDWLGLTTDH